MPVTAERFRRALTPATCWMSWRGTTKTGGATGTPPPARRNCSRGYGLILWPALPVHCCSVGRSFLRSKSSLAVKATGKIFSAPLAKWKTRSSRVTSWCGWQATKTTGRLSSKWPHPCSRRYYGDAKSNKRKVWALAEETSAPEGSRGKTASSLRADGGRSRCALRCRWATREPAGAYASGERTADAGLPYG